MVNRAVDKAPTTENKSLYLFRGVYGYSQENGITQHSHVSGMIDYPWDGIGWRYEASTN